MVRRVIIFSGRVQGVGFRATASACARVLPVSGWVRNEPDGSVRMEVQGEVGDVDEALGRLRAQMGANIRGEHAHETAIVPGEAAFVIAR